MPNHDGNIALQKEEIFQFLHQYGEKLDAVVISIFLKVELFGSNLIQF